MRPDSINKQFDLYNQLLNYTRSHSKPNYNGRASMPLDRDHRKGTKDSSDSTEGVLFYRCLSMLAGVMYSWFGRTWANCKLICALIPHYLPSSCHAWPVHKVHAKWKL